MNNVIPFPTPETVLTDEEVCWVLGDHTPQAEITDEDSEAFWSQT
jgi:hypothetical protein